MDGYCATKGKAHVMVDEKQVELGQSWWHSPGIFVPRTRFSGSADSPAVPQPYSLQGIHQSSKMEAQSEPRYLTRSAGPFQGFPEEATGFPDVFLTKSLLLPLQTVDESSVHAFKGTALLVNVDERVMVAIAGWI
ncbi:hypothetical protein GH714_038013 [Hevea brasiliensis]|uniref:Uncharacterized protein n=1 Tax=Hevea brasiliensis TaxID=3981 RepID=A0A6A6LWQ4_HEVBR|nr:hypothetical protein GH714_038013 [Hevea brasiliensis]